MAYSSQVVNSDATVRQQQPSNAVRTQMANIQRSGGQISGDNYAQRDVRKSAIVLQLSSPVRHASEQAAPRFVSRCYINSEQN